MYPKELSIRASKIGCRCGISEPKPSLTLVVAAPSAARTTNGSMKVLSVPSIPWGWNTKWSLTQTESKPICSARRAPPMILSRSVSGPKCGKSKPYSVAMFKSLQRFPSAFRTVLRSRRVCQPAAARLAHHFPVLENELPSHQRVYRQPTHFPAGIRGPATFAENLVIRDDLLFIEVDGDQVCSRSHANRALARGQPKQLCPL